MSNGHPLCFSEEMTRADWDLAFLFLMKPIVADASPGHARVRFPGAPSNNGSESDSLEAFARSLWMAGPWLSTHPTGEGIVGSRNLDIAEFYRQGLISGTDPNHPESWHPLVTLPQTLVEAAAIAWNLWLARERLWVPLSTSVRERILEWLELASSIQPRDNNWRLFSIVLQAVCKHLGGSFDQPNIDRHLDRVEAFYVGDGWYNDGPVPGNDELHLDYYNAFVLHPYLLYWCWLDGDTQPDRRDRIFERARAFENTFVHWFAADGSFPCFGRSTVYRTAVTHAFIWGVIAGSTKLPVGQVRRLCNRVLSRSLTTPGVLDRDGRLTLGFARQHLPMLERYSGPGSPYWAAKAFAVLAIPQDHAFWTVPEEPLPIERADYVDASSVTGFVVTGDRATGHVQIVNGQSLHLGKKYSNISYSSHFGYEIDRRGRAWDTDPFGEASLTLSRDGLRWHRRSSVRSVRIVDGILVTEGTYRLGLRRLAPTATVVTGVAFVGDQQIRVHRVTTRVKVLAREGAFALGWTGNLMPRFVDGALSYASTPTVASGIRPLLGYERSNLPLQTDHNVLHPRSCVPSVETTRRLRGTFTLASASLARPVAFTEEAIGRDVGDRLRQVLQILTEAV